LYNDTTSTLFKHSPAKAAFLSAVVPGLGQIYNGKGLFWKLPILYAGIAVETYVISYMNNNYQMNHSAYVNYSNYIKNLNGNPNLYSSAVAVKLLSQVVHSGEFLLHDVQTSTLYGGYSNFGSTSIISDLKSANDFYKQYLDLNVIIMAGIYFLNIIEATVTAYFFEYNMSDDLSLRISPTILNNSISNIGTFGVKLSFNLHK
jgi:hypothetical protein